MELHLAENRMLRKTKIYQTTDLITKLIMALDLFHLINLMILYLLMTWEAMETHRGLEDTSLHHTHPVEANLMTALKRKEEGTRIKIEEKANNPRIGYAVF